MSRSREDLKLELVRCQASYIELMHQTSSEIAKLKFCITKLSSQQQRDQNIYPHLFVYNDASKITEIALFKLSEKLTNIQSFEEQIDDLRDAKIALIQSTSFEINRLRNIIKYITMNNNDDGDDDDDDDDDGKINIFDAVSDDINKFEIEKDVNKRSEFNWNEIVKHNKKSDLWLVYDNKVFDITSFLSYHPGGIEVILNIASKSQDVTKVFTKLKHPPIADRIIAQHYIGNVCNKTAYDRMSMDLTGILPIWENDNLNLNNIDSLRHEQQQHNNMKMQCVIAWNDIYSVKIAVLDKQHENLMNLINDIYNFFEVKYLLEFLKRWDVHCKTEETLFEYYNFDESTASKHIVAHKEIYHFIKDESTAIRIKYNGQQPKCKELIRFAKKMSVIFKDHHFEFDAKYIDHLDEPILNGL